MDLMDPAKRHSSTHGEPMTAPRSPIIEAKVKTSAAAAAVVSLVLAMLGQYVFHDGPVPEPLTAIITTLVTALVTGGITFLVGWVTRHTPRDIIHIDTEN
jgi:ABC-type multidrug transport system permease subunit